MGSFIERKMKEADENPEDFISQEHQERFQKDIEDLIKKYQAANISLKEFVAYMIYPGAGILFRQDGAKAVSQLFNHIRLFEPIESSFGKRRIPSKLEFCCIFNRLW